MTSKDFLSGIFFLYTDLHTGARWATFRLCFSFLLWASQSRGAKLSLEARSLTISRHAHRQAFLEAAVLAPVAVHAHDETVLILHTHLVVDVLLNAAAKESLGEKNKAKQEPFEIV